MARPLEFCGDDNASGASMQSTVSDGANDMNLRLARAGESAGQADMHERLRRLLFEAFFGTEDLATQPTGNVERSHLVLVGASQRRATIMQRKLGRIAHVSADRDHEITRPASHEPAARAGTLRAERVLPMHAVADRLERRVEQWTAPTLIRL